MVVGGVTEGSPADRQGLKEGDIILDVEKTQIRSRRQLYQELWKKRPGERICLRVLENETSIELSLIAPTAAIAMAASRRHRPSVIYLLSHLDGGRRSIGFGFIVDQGFIALLQIF